MERDSLLGKRILVTGGSGFIGSHLIERLLELGLQVLSLDLVPSRIESHKSCWKYCDILDRGQIQELLLDFDPEYVVHLAALAEMGGESIEDFKVNTSGTKNLLRAIELSMNVTKFVMTSTQHVRAPGSGPMLGAEDFKPYKLYGESKMIAELEVRKSDFLVHWVIIRPTIIWGPGHPNLTFGLWKLLFTRKYFHPNRDQVVKSYGYVKNTVWQITELLELGSEYSNQKTLYLGDGVLRQLDWINAISLALTSKNVRTVPKPLIHLLSICGDLLGLFGIAFPIYKDRYLNLVTTNLVPIDETLIMLGSPPYSLQLGAKETSDWLKLEIYGNNRDDLK